MSLSIEEVNSLILKIRAGDLNSKDILVNENIPLVWSLVHRYKNTYYDKEDLFQIGCLGLLKAIDKFDVSFNVAFSTYAVPLILGEIKKFFRDDGAIKVSRSLKELNIQVNKLRDDYFNKYGKEMRIEDISKELMVSVNDIVMCLDANFYPTSINETIYEKDSSSLVMEDRLSYDDTDKFINLITLKDSLNKLDNKERLLIELRYYQDMNQEEVAKRFNVSQVQISRMEKKIIEKLRKQFV
jgi:RNA polymerase sporulation-specific sigma factor